MDIGDIITPQDIIPNLVATTKSEVITELAQRMSQNHPELEFNKLVNLVIEREKLGSTAESWFAMPHCRHPDATRMYAVFGRSLDGIEYEADKAPVYIVVMFVVPDEASSEYLKLISRLIDLIKQDWFRDAVMRLPADVDPELLYRLIKDG